MFCSGIKIGEACCVMVVFVPLGIRSPRIGPPNSGSNCRDCWGPNGGYAKEEQSYPFLWWVSASQISLATTAMTSCEQTQKARCGVVSHNPSHCDVTTVKLATVWWCVLRVWFTCKVYVEVCQTHKKCVSRCFRCRPLCRMRRTLQTLQTHLNGASTRLHMDFKCKADLSKKQKAFAVNAPWLDAGMSEK